MATQYSRPTVIPRIAAHFPPVKVLLAIRNPVDRAYSFYQSRAPHEDWRDFEHALEQAAELLDRGRYIEQIELLYEHFPPEQVRLLFYDDLKSDERRYLEQVHDFLGVDTGFEPSVIGMPARAAMYPNLRRRLKKAGFQWLVDAAQQELCR